MPKLSPARSQPPPGGPDQDQRILGETAAPPSPSSEPGQRHSLTFYVLLAAALYVFIISFHLLAPILFAFILILLISLAANPVIVKLRALTGGRKLATGLVTALFILSMILAGYIFYGPIQGATTKIADRLPDYWERLQKPLIRIEKQAEISEQKLQEEVTQEVVEEAREAGEFQTARRAVQTPAPASASEAGSLRSSLTHIFQGLAGGFTNVVFNTAEILIVLVTVFFGVAYTLANPRPIFGAIFMMVPERHHQQTLVILQRIGIFVPGWAWATLLGMATIGVLVFLAMWPLFGFTDALVLGLIAGIFEAVPYLGPILSAVPALLFALGDGGLKPLWVLVAYLGVQALENNAILPLLMANSMRLHPLAVIFSMLLCVIAFGVLGVLIAPPLVAIVQILHDELYRKRFLPHATPADLDRLVCQSLPQKAVTHHTTQ